jgi:hypothetical protein
MAGLVVAAAAVKEEFHWETCGANEKAARQEGKEEEKVGSGRKFATWERKRNIFARTKRGRKTTSCRKSIAVIKFALLLVRRRQRMRAMF